MRTHSLRNMSLMLASGLAGVWCSAAWAQDRTIIVQPPPVVERERVVVIPAERIVAGQSAHPLGAQATTEDVPLNTIHLYKSTRFRSDREVLGSVTNLSAGGSHEIKGDLEDSVSSLRWNLPPGVVVVFYEDDDAKGEQLAIWGKGEMDELSRWNFNDKASSWAWYYAGGAESVTMELERAAVVYPTGTVVIAREVPALAPGTFHVYKNKNFGGEAVTLPDITLSPPGKLNRLPSDLNNSVTSMRWNLPPGVVVMFYQGEGGNQQQVATWGNGEISDVDVFDMNDKISQWAWYYIGAPALREPLGYSAPVGNDRVIVAGDRDSIDLIAREMRRTELGVAPNDLVARKNPTGDGTFVFVPATKFDGVERHVVWMVVDSRPFAITGPAKLVTPDIPSVTDAGESFWSATGLSRTNPEQDAIKILFKD